MHLRIGFVLLVSTAAAIAQQYSPANLPDAPGYVTQQQKQIPDTTPNSRVVASEPARPFISRQYLNVASPASVSHTPLVFAGTDTMTNGEAHDGTAGAVANCGHTSAEKSTGSDWINSLLSITSHKGGHYCALGEGGFWKRGTYAMTRAFVAHRYDGANSFNASLGPGVASAMPGSYYAYPNYTGERLAARYASAVGRDTLKNMFSEFWPDFATHVLRRHP